MKKKLTSVLVVLVLCLTQRLFSQVIAPEDFQKGLAQTGVQLLDVRTMEEYKNGHIKNSLQADWNKREQFIDRIQYVDKTKPVYVYCAAGARSNAAANWMRENGFQDVKELKGGMTAWNAEHKPTEGLPVEVQITPEAFTKMIAGRGTVLVDFGSPSCPPCVQMEPVLQALQKNANPKFELLKIDPTLQPGIAGHLKIDVFPTFLVFKNGELSFRKQGVATLEELKAALL